jgi:hypothetical protein
MEASDISRGWGQNMTKTMHTPAGISCVLVILTHVFAFWDTEIDDGDGYLTPNELQILEAKANFVRNSS